MTDRKGGSYSLKRRIRDISKTAYEELFTLSKKNNSYLFIHYLWVDFIALILTIYILFDLFVCASEPHHNC